MDTKLKFAKALCEMEGKDYLAAVMAYVAAPAIEKKKPSYLMTFTSKGKNMLALWRQYGKELCETFKLQHFELKTEKECIRVLLYREKALTWYLSHERNAKFMNKMGYGAIEHLHQKLGRLKRRFDTCCPHEIGIFLGIPVEDVEGFIAHGGQNCLMCKYWKVYENPRRAQLLFNVYDTARNHMAEFIYHWFKTTDASKSILKSTNITYRKEAVSIATLYIK